MSDRDRAISDLAYRIWEEAGRPEGLDDRHWHEAQRRYDAGEGTPSPDVEARAPRLKDAKSKKAARAAGGPAAEAVIAKSGKAGRKAKAALQDPIVPKTAEAPKPKGKTKPKPADLGPIAPSSKAARSRKG